MNRIVKIVLIIEVIDVNVIVIAPTHWPGIDHLKPIAAVLEAGTVIDDYRAVEAEMVFPSEVLMEMLFRNASVVGGRAVFRLSTPHRALVVITDLPVAILLGSLLLFGLGLGVLLRLLLVCIAGVLLILLRPASGRPGRDGYPAAALFAGCPELAWRSAQLVSGPPAGLADPAWVLPFAGAVRRDVLPWDVLHPSDVPASPLPAGDALVRAAGQIR